MSVASGALSSRSVHPASPVLLTKSGPLGKFKSSFACHHRPAGFAEALGRSLLQRFVLCGLATPLAN